MADNLWVHETFANATEGYIFGDSDWYETFATSTGQLYREMQKEYGRCVSKMYQEPDAKQIGWVFHGRTPYEDADESYLREVWVQVSSTKPEQHLVTQNVTSPF